MTNNDSRLVYSTDGGRVKHSKDKPSSGNNNSTYNAHQDGVIRIFKESKGRKGKGVSVVVGLPLEEKELKNLAKKLKQLCGTGGAVKGSTIEIQGDNRDKLKQALEKMDYQVKLAGG